MKGLLPEGDAATLHVVIRQTRTTAPGNVTHYLVAEVRLCRWISDEDPIGSFITSPLDHVWWRVQMSIAPQPGEIPYWYRPDTRGQDTADLSTLTRGHKLLAKNEKAIERMDDRAGRVPWSTHKGLAVWLHRMARVTDAKTIVLDVIPTDKSLTRHRFNHHGGHTPETFLDQHIWNLIRESIAETTNHYPYVTG